MTLVAKVSALATRLGSEIKSLTTAVAANTAKVSNATHTGDVTGATTLTIEDGKVTKLKTDAGVQASLGKADSALQSGDIGSTVQGYDADMLKADTTANLTAAFTAAIDDDGTITTGTYTPTTAAGSQYKKIIGGGAFTLAPPVVATNTATTLSLFIINNSSAGAITTSGFTKVAGDAFTTTNGDKFSCRIEVNDIGGTEYSTLTVLAMQ